MLSNRQDSNLSVAVLDCDSGQPELFTPGCASLTLCSKGFLSSPYYSCSSNINGKNIKSDGIHLVSKVFLGSVSPKSNPRAYFDAYSYLAGVYIHEYLPKGIPLVVNTHGWIRGIGFQTVQHVVQAISPTHLVLFESLDQAESPSELLSPNPYQEDETSGFGVEFQSNSPSPLSRRRRAAEVVACPSLSNQPGVPAKTFLLPPWFQHHATSVVAEGLQPISSEEEVGSAAAERGAAPPRAARSPVDLRALRWLLYFSQSPQLPLPLQAALDGTGAAESFTGGIPDLADSEALALFSAHLKVAFRESAHKARSEQREARAPSEGMFSPAFSLYSRRAEWVSFSSGVRVFATPEDVPLGTDASNVLDKKVESIETKRKIAKSFLGSVVGICSRELDHPLACIGLAIVRALDEATGSMELVTPVSLSGLSESSFFLVGWDSPAGPADLPPQLLYRNAPLGDPFCMLPSMLASTSVVSAKASNNRKNLKRHRFDQRK
jgi:hypothetical protein